MSSNYVPAHIMRHIDRVASAHLAQRMAVRLASEDASYWFDVSSVKNISAKEYEAANFGDSSINGDAMLVGVLHVKPKGAIWSAQFPVNHRVNLAEDPGGFLHVFPQGKDPVAQLLGMATGDYKVETEIRKALGKVEFVPYGQKSKLAPDKQAWEWLKEGLRKQKLPTENGTPRQATVGEFMLMTGKPVAVRGMRGGPFWQFKHAGTRNYVLIEDGTGKMIVPQTTQPFFRGTFDKFAKEDVAVIVGDIFVASWGYEQTNVDFYQVTAVLPTMLKLRPIAKKTAQQKTDMSRTVVPEANKFTGPEIRKKLSSSWDGKPSVKLTSYSWAYKWDGKPKMETSYG